MISIENVSKKFLQGEKEITVLDGLNFNLEVDGIIAIIGRSGSGKSTFLSLLAGLDKPTSGNVKINDENISEMNEQELTAFRARNIGIVFQNFHLVDNFTALENVLLPLEVLKIPNPIVKAKEVLKLVGLEGREDHSLSLIHI